MTCRCATPKPTPAEEDTYVTLLGVVVWCSGVSYVVCERCGERLAEPTARTAEPTDGDDDTARVLSSRPLSD